MNKRIVIFTLLSFLCISTILTVSADDNDNPGPAHPDLVETSQYIIVFKPNAPLLKIANQIERLKLHQADNSSRNKAFSNSSKTTKDPYNTTSASNNTSSPSTTSSSKEYNTIGKFKWYSAEFKTQALENHFATAKENDTSIDAVHYYVQDAKFSLQTFVQTNPSSWGIDRIDQRTGLDGLYRFPSAQGTGVDIYLMDTGINPNHTDIAGRATTGLTVTGDVNDPSDYNGHGTFVAGVCCGTRYGVAKGAEIVSVKTLDSEGNGQLSDVLVGLEWIVKQHTSKPNAKSIVNLSLGALYSQATNDAVTEAISLGIHFSVAAGNYGDDACKYSPGSNLGAITVGAIDEDDSVSYYSNFGKCVDIFAPGTNIQSIWPTSDTATHTLTGTSMAAPHVAGVMAIFLSQANYTPPELQSYIKRISTLITEDFTINNTGTFYNENKTVVDNAVNTGYKVADRMDSITLVNILYNHPDDGRESWIYGEALSQASSPLVRLSLLLSTLLFIVTVIVL